jgi:hypothetical protein
MKNDDDKMDAIHGVGASGYSSYNSRTNWDDVQAAAQANNPSATGSQGLQQKMSENEENATIQTTQTNISNQQIEQVSKEKFKNLFDQAMSLLPTVQKMIQQQILQELKGPMGLNHLGAYASADGLGHPTGSPIGDPNGTGSGSSQMPQAVDYKKHAPTGPQSVDRPADRFRGSVGHRGFFSKLKK